MKRAISVLLLLTAIPALADEADKLHQLFEDEWQWTMENYPTYATYVGYPGQNDRWTDMSLDAIARREAHARDVLDKIQAIDRSQLSDTDQLNYDLFLHQAQMDVEGAAFPDELLPLNQLQGVQQDIAQTISYTRLNNLADYEDLLKRLQRADARIEQEIALLREGLDRGITAPKIVLRDVPEQVQNQIVDDVTTSPLYRPFTKFPESIPKADQNRLQTVAKEAITNKIFPAFQQLHDFLVRDYIPNARQSIARTELPQGDDWYAYNIKARTTTDMTAQEIHDLGLSEVKRIRKEMEKVIDQAEFDGDFAEFTEFLRTDDQFYFDSADELLMAYRDIAKRADPELMKLFGTLPRTPYGVIPVPSYAEKSQTTAYYMPGSPDSARPGYFYANTYALDTRPKWEMEALTLHEAVPGHHLQISRAQELEGIPEFRRWGGPTAYVEGWGLYAESLGEEMGFYQDPYSKFGQLTYEMWRAVRLVVDTGMHALGWSRQEAIDFFAENGSKPIHDITVEIDRYIVWPGQALAYKIGELKFKELRQRAKTELGENFNIRQFHDACLLQGALPLDILEHQIEQWIAEQKANR